MKKTEKTEDKAVTARVLLLTTIDGEVRITLPATSRVTFGPTIPYERKNDYSSNGRGYSLRVYENTKNDSLMAVFSGVISFRDVTIPHEKLVIRESGKTVWKSDENGFKVEEEVARDKKWINPLRQLEEK